MSRVHLRPPEASDAPRFLELARASADLYRGWVDPPGDEAAFEELRTRERSEARLICLNDGKDLAGFARLSEIVRGGLQGTYLGFYAFAQHAGRGHMKEGLGLMLDLAFGDLGLHRVEANVQPANHRSLALLERLGFRKEGFSPRYLYLGGEWRDHERWAILADEWRRPPR